MLPPKNRLKLTRDFARVFKFGRSFYTLNLRLKLAKNNQKETRFGFVAGLAVSKKATIRNRLKRQVREMVRLRIKEGLIKPNFDVVINLKSSLIKLKYLEIEKEVNLLLQNAGVCL